MSRFLSDEWIDELGRALETGTDRVTGLDGVAFTVQQIVTGTPNGEVAYHVDITGDRARVTRGRASSPDVTFTQDYATAAAISGGTESAQAAFMTGRLRLGGDVSVLLEHREALSRLTDGFAAIRASTTY